MTTYDDHSVIDPQFQGRHERYQMHDASTSAQASYFSGQSLKKQWHLSRQAQREAALHQVKLLQSTLLSTSDGRPFERRAANETSDFFAAGQDSANHSKSSFAPGAFVPHEKAYGAEQSEQRDATHRSVTSGSRGPWKRPKRKGSALWRVVFWIALVVLIVSLGSLAYLGFTYWRGQNAYDTIADESFQVSDSANTAPALSAFVVDWDRLRQINPDIVAWIYVPGTVISYPVVHRDNDDEYYLTHNFNNESTGQFGAEYGAIMLSGGNDSNFSDANNVIYGHNMANGSMFAQFAQFFDSSVFNQYRTIYLLTPNGNYQLETFAVLRVPETEVAVAQPNFSTPQEQEAFVQGTIDASIVSPDPAVPPAQEIGQTFVFSTCDGADNTYRYVTFSRVVNYEPTAGDGLLANPDDVSNVNEDVNERVS